MTVSADKASVKADISRLECGNSFKLGGDEVRLCDAVFFKEKIEDIELYSLACLVLAERDRADEEVEVLALDEAIAAADVNGDGEITADDLTVLSRYVAGIISEL